jgi:hypothetical protein
MGRLSSKPPGAGRERQLTDPIDEDAHLRRQMATLRVHHRYRRLLSRSVREHLLELPGLPVRSR